MLDSQSTRKRLLLALSAVIGLGILMAAGYLTAETNDTLISATSGELANSPESVPALADDLEQPAEGILARAQVANTPLAIRPARIVQLKTETDSRTLWTLQSTLGAFLMESGVVVDPDHKIIADGVFVPSDELSQTDLPNSVEIGRFLRVTIDDGLNQQVLRTAAPTVRVALQEAGITLKAADEAEPSLDTPLLADTLVTVKRSFPLSIHVDGKYIQTRTAHTQIDKVLDQVDVHLVENDFTIPHADTVLKPNDLIEVVRVTEDFVTEDVSIPYHTLWQGTDELPIDSQGIISEGLPGIRRQRFRVRYENGIEVERLPDGEWVVREPVNKVVGYGTRIELGVVETPEGLREYWRVVRMRVTSYTAASSGKDPGSPGYGLTASGLPAGYGVVAIDRSVVPFRSHVYVPGYGIGFAGDTGGGIHGRWIDLGYEVEDFVSWSGYADVYYLTPVPPLEDINFLLPAALP